MLTGASRNLTAAITSLVLLAGCTSTDGEADTSTPIRSSVAPNTSQTAPVPTAVSTTSVAPVAIVGVYEGVGFYPGCGTEQLDHRGVTWYSVAYYGLAPADDLTAAALAELKAVARETSPVIGPRGLVRTVPPGPGDDVGTLVVWADGVARWVSDSRRLDVWLIDDEIESSKVC